jgi:hypothetical protein
MHRHLLRSMNSRSWSVLRSTCGDEWSMSFKINVAPFLSALSIRNAYTRSIVLQRVLYKMGEDGFDLETRKPITREASQMTAGTS